MMQSIGAHGVVACWLSEGDLRASGRVRWRGVASASLLCMKFILICVTLAWCSTMPAERLAKQKRKWLLLQATLQVKRQRQLKATRALPLRMLDDGPHGVLLS